MKDVKNAAAGGGKLMRPKILTKKKKKSYRKVISRVRVIILHRHRLYVSVLPADIC